MKRGADNEGKKGACSIVAATAGLILGYHLAQTCGVMSFNDGVKHLYWDDQEGGEADSTYPEILPLFTSAAFLVALYCCPLASYVTRAYGRRPVLITGAAYFVVGSLVSAFSREIQVFIFGRILLAVGLSLVNQSASVYLSEMAPYQSGPSLNVMFQLAITVGVVVADVVNYNYDILHRGWIFGGAVVPGFILFVAATLLHDTPISLVERNRLDEAEKTLKTIRGTSDVAQELGKLVAASEASNLFTSPWVKLLHDSKYRPQLVFVTAVQLFQSFTPVAFLIFATPWLFVTPSSMDSAFIVERELCMPALLLSLVNVLLTFLGVYAVNWMCRRSIFILPPRKMIILLTAVGLLTKDRYGVRGAAILSNVYAGVLMACICNHISSHTASFRPLRWFVPSGIFSAEVQSAANSIYVAAHIICVHVIMQFFIWTLCKVKCGLFFGSAIIYLGMSVSKRLQT